MIPSVTQTQIFTALGNLLTAILPAGVSVVIGQTNRVAMPLGDFVEMWALFRPRLSTNVETPQDNKFTASIAGTVMTVTAVATGVIIPSNQVFGTGVTDSTKVQAQTSGAAGGPGTYTIAPSQTVSARTMSAGDTLIEQSTEAVLQLDVHGPNSADNSQVISTIMRSAYAVDQMAASGVTPLFSDDPRQAPFDTAAKQYDERWTVDVHVQIKPTISTPQQFSDSTTLTIVEVDVAYPPS